MNRRMIYIVAAVLVCAAMLFVVRKLKKQYVPSINLPGIALQDLQGRAIDLRSYSGKPLVINFWGTWCGPCRGEMPYFEKASVKYANKVNFLMVSDEAVEKLTDFKNAHPYTFTYAWSVRSFHQLGITAVPFTYFYNSKGDIVHKEKETFSEKSLDEMVGQLVEEK